MKTKSYGKHSFCRKSRNKKYQNLNNFMAKKGGGGGDHD